MEIENNNLLTEETTEETEATEETTEETEATEETTEETEATETIQYIVQTETNNFFDTPINDLPLSTVALLLLVFILALSMIGGFKHE